jgi:hypothetical protein
MTAPEPAAGAEGVVASPDAPIPEPASAESAPRYRPGAADDGAAVVGFRDAPNLELRYAPGATLTPSAVRRLGPRRIFLDGACAGPPFYDNRRSHYSFDHHEGCVRSATAAACEQAAVALFEGLPLAEGDWTIYLNGADADSVLAAWLLANHAELRRDDRRLLAAAMPLVRTEGAIDAHGPGAELLAGTGAAAAGLASALVPFAAACRAVGSGVGATARLAAALAGLDALLLPGATIAELDAYAEWGRIPLAGGKVAVLAASSRGVYAAEAFYRARCGEALALLVLRTGAAAYTLKLVDRFSRNDLTALYSRLNRLDPAVAGRTAADRWGGSATIGGSPRAAGTGLPPEAIAAAVARVFGAARPFRSLGTWFRSFFPA